MVFMFVYCRRRIDESFDDTDDEQDNDETESDDTDDALQLFVKKGKGAIKKESARKSKWPEKVLDDFIDIVVSSNSYKRKLIFTHCKSQKNGPIYEKILEELNVRAFSRGEVITSTVPQLRSKFKKCVSVYKRAVLTQKAATGIKRFQEYRGFGKWFHALLEVVRTRDSCRPEWALEPSSSNSERTSPSSEGLGEEQEPLFAKKKQTMKEKVDATTVEVTNLAKATNENDPTKQLISFKMEEM